MFTGYSTVSSVVVLWLMLGYYPNISHNPKVGKASGNEKCCKGLKMTNF